MPGRLTLVIRHLPLSEGLNQLRAFATDPATGLTIVFDSDQRS